MPLEAPTIREARFPADREAVLNIFREYVASSKTSLAYQEYEQEFANLPGAYARPSGCILLVENGAAIVGCGAFRRVNGETCEMKRVYLHPSIRGLGLGRKLVERLIIEARRAGFGRICLDVIPEFKTARQLYEELGFTEAAAISYNPVPGTQFLALNL